MKNLLLSTFFIAIFISTSCMEENSEKPMFRLKEFNSGYAQSHRSRTFLLPNDVNYRPGYTSIIEYQNGKVSRVFHKNSIGLSLGVTGYNANGIDEYYEILYSGNKVELTKKVDSEEYVYTPEVTKLTIDKSGRILERINNISKDTTDYYYLGNGLINKSISRNGGYSTVTRFFYFDSNKNLVQIKGEIDNNWGSKYHVFEYFEDFDTGINGFKNLGIIEGAYIRSLSQNNFNVYSCATYNQENILIDTMRITLKVEYDENGYPIYGDCSMK